jgi:Zn-dependent protease
MGSALLTEVARSIQLARVFGIRIGVDPSWFFVLFLVIWLMSGYYDDLSPGDEVKSFGLAVLSAFLFFFSIVLHELGHAVVAMRNGIRISGIDLWLFGGVAKMERDTDSPGVEFRVAAAGPLVTLVIVGICFGLGSWIGSASDLIETSRFDENSAADEAVAVLGYLASINAAVLVLNLLPGFPLDGGRIVRAIAWWRTGDRLRATRIAARMGGGLAYLLMGLGAVWFLQGDLISGIWLVLIGLFLRQAARTAEFQTAVTSRIAGVRVADVMDAEPVAVPEDLPASRAMDEYFLRYRWPWFPVVDTSGRLTGIVGRDAVEQLPEAVRGSRTVGSVMAADAPGSTLRVGLEDPLEALLGLEALQRLGAVLAVDREGTLRGVVTVDAVRRALRPAAS